MTERVHVEFDRVVLLGHEPIHVKHEFIAAEEYIGFLARTDLGKQYPKEDYVDRVRILVSNVQISLVARTLNHAIVGVCFGLTDFAYWLFMTDLGVDRDYERRGIGKVLMEAAHVMAGGERKIIQFAYANENAMPFYQKLGMRQSTDVVEKVGIDWTPFEVGKNA